MLHSVAIRIAIVVCALAGSASAQNVTGSIDGVVRDPAGGVVPGAAVRATNTGTSALFRAITNAEGQYAIRTIPIGVYDLVVEAAGFKKFQTTGIRVQVDEVSRVDAELSVGAATESVTVTGEAVTVDTESATLKSVVDQRRIEELPLNGRNATQLMRLIVGV